MSKWATSLIIFCAGCLGPQVRTTAVGPTHQLPPAWLFSGVGSEQPVRSARYLGRFKVTYYWVVEEKDYPQSKRMPLYSVDGKLVGRFSESFVRDFKTESCARLRDGRCLSYLKNQNRVQVVERFLGNGGHTLTELKSIAVDPSVIPLGSKVYIPQFEGLTVNGKHLNGIFYAHDIGSAVKGNHIDIFLGDKNYMQTLSSTGGGSSSRVDVYLLE
jgi:3D (Asp-Asp-Asp) domain-containing protein